MDGFADALVRAAAANVAAHEIVDIGVARIRFFRQQRDGRHNLPRLTVTALWDIFGNPGLLDGMQAFGRNSFDGRDFFPGDAADLRDAGTRRFTIDVNGTRAAQRHTATKFCAGHTESVAEDPKERHFGTDVDRLGFSVECEGDGHGALLGENAIVQQVGVGENHRNIVEMSLYK